jgi:two-component system, OmpR family, response regulator
LETNMDRIKILIADRDGSMRDVVAQYLRRSHYDVLIATDCAEAHRSIAEDRPALAILGLMPETDGLCTCRPSHGVGAAMATIALLASESKKTRIQALDSGFDDCLSRPFSPRELVARVEAILRRVRAKPEQRPERVYLAGLVIDLANRQALRQGQVVSLSPCEFALLGIMAERPGRVFTRQELLGQLESWDCPHAGASLDTHIMK